MAAEAAAISLRDSGGASGSDAQTPAAAGERRKAGNDHPVAPIERGDETELRPQAAIPGYCFAYATEWR